MNRNTYLNSHIFRKIANQGLALACVKAMVHLTRGKLHDKLFLEKMALVKKRVAKDKIELASAVTGQHSCDDTIWVCWLQGEANMPEIVRLCYDSVIKHSAGHEVILLTLDNYRNWVSLPEKYSELFACEKLMKSQLADLIRVNILSQRGGLWLDATIFVLSDIPDWYFEVPFFSIKSLPNVREISNNRWTGFCLGRGTEEDVIFSRLSIFFDRYTELHDEFIDYLLLDYAVDYIYDKYSDSRDVIKSLPMNNVNTLELLPRLFDVYDKSEFSKFTKDTVLFKLRYRESEIDVSRLKAEKNNVYCHLRELVYGEI